MRVHVHLDDELVTELDREVGQRGRSAFVENCVRQELDRRRRWRLIWSALEGPPIAETGHVWDPDPAAYFRATRREESEKRDARLRAERSNGR